MPRLLQILCFALSLMTAGLPPGAQTHVPSNRVFNVKDFGASGRKEDNAQGAIQKAIDACAQAGGGMVYVPPGSYTSGTIHLRSHVRLYVESGATIFSSKDKNAFDKEALLYGEGLENLTIEGRGAIDGQAEYERRLNDLDDRYIRDNQLLTEAGGKSLMRSFPKKNSHGNSCFSSGARMSASPGSRSCARRPTRFIPSPASAWSSTASTFARAWPTAFGQTASTRTDAKICASRTARL